MKKIPMTLLCGYLGAGKTTLMNKVLTNQKGYKVAVIVNDIGEVNVDETLIARGGKVEDTSDIVPLTNGCICCTLKSALAQGIEDLIKTGKYDYIMIEASGVCEPMPIAQELELIKNGTLDNIVSVVDACRMVEEFDGGNALLKKDMDEEDLESLLVQQVEFCSTLIINKVDLVTPEQLAKVRAVVKALQPNVKVIETTHGDVDVADILGTNKFDFEKVYTSASWCQQLENGEDHDDEDVEDNDEHEHHHEDHEHNHEEQDHHDHEHHHHHHEHKHEGEDGGDEDEYGISSFIYFRRKPFNQAKLEELAAKWPKNIIRSKGMMWFDDDWDNSLVFETAGRQISAGFSGQWLAACPESIQKQELQKHPEIAKEWDDQVGDRMIKMCIIGQNMDKEAICALLDACLSDKK